MTEPIVLWKDYEGFQNFELEKPSKVQSLMSSCGNLEDNSESAQMTEAWFVKSQKEI